MSAEEATTKAEEQPTLLEGETAKSGSEGKAGSGNEASGAGSKSASPKNVSGAESEGKQAASGEDEAPRPSKLKFGSDAEGHDAEAKADGGESPAESSPGSSRRSTKLQRKSTQAILDKFELEASANYVPPSFKRYDPNDDLEFHGFMDFELCEFADAFKLLDILGDGILTVPDLPRILRILGDDQADDDLKNAVNKIDPQGTGEFSFQRFIELMAYFRRPPLTEPELKECFDLLDADLSGAVDARELKRLLTAVGNKLSDADADAMVEEADASGDGEIQFDEFSHLILSTQT